MFVGLHATLAMATKTPELQIDPQEGEAFMRCAQNVMRHYSVETTQKTLDWIALMGCAGTMYGTRFVAIANRKGQARQPVEFRPRRTGPAEVVDFPRSHQAPTSPAPVDAPPDFVPSVLPGEPDGDGF